ncbi:MAG: hypothetical protein Q9220_002202 [cf. Caloplaca sp. 1 TL-2023]
MNTDEKRVHDHTEVFPIFDVKEKWAGTHIDKQDMVTLGRRQELRRNFQFLTILGFGSTLICTWEILLANILFISIDGGTADLFWGYIVVLIGVALTYATARAPTAGGQYHWVSEFAPPKHQKLLSYMVGWICMIGWQAGLLSVGFIVGTIIQGLIVLNDPNYGFERWHGTLLVWAVTSFCVIFNTLFAKRLPAVEIVVLLIHTLGFFAVIIPLWILSPRATATEALLTFTNGGGWPTTGLSSMIGLLTPMGSLCGFDCSVHMCRSTLMLFQCLVLIDAQQRKSEMQAGLFPDPSCDLSEIVDTPTGYPFIQVFHNVTRSLAATNVLVTIMIVTLTACCISEVATSSRQLWSFARDKGIPFSDWFAYVSLLKDGHGASS